MYVFVRSMFPGLQSNVSNARLQPYQALFPPCCTSSHLKEYSKDMSHQENPFALSRRTTIIFLSVFPAVALLALLMGIWHCIRKRNIAKRKEVEDVEIDATLRQRAFLASDDQLPERSRSTSHQVPKARIPNLPNLKIDMKMDEVGMVQIQSAPAIGRARVDAGRNDGLPRSAHPLNFAPMQRVGGWHTRQARDAGLL